MSNININTDYLDEILITLGIENIGSYATLHSILKDLHDKAKSVGFKQGVKHGERNSMLKNHYTIPISEEQIWNMDHLERLDLERELTAVYSSYGVTIKGS